MDSKAPVLPQPTSRPEHSALERMIYGVARLVLRLLFRVEVRGLQNYPRAGRRLIIANHTSWLDAVLLAAFLPDRLVFAIDTRIARLGWVRPLLRLATVYPVDPLQPLLLKSLCTSVEEGWATVIFPEGRLSTTGGLMKVYDGAGFVAHRTAAAVVAVHIDGAHLSVFTRLGHQYRRRWFPKITLTVSPSEVIAASTPRDECTPRIYRLLSESAFAAMNGGHSIYRELVTAAGRHGRRRRIWESIDGEGLSFDGILGRSAYLGARIAGSTPSGSTVGIMMPTTISGGLVFWALQFVHRVPAWLNFSMGLSAFASTVRTAGVRTVVTSRAFVETAHLEAQVGLLQAAGVDLIYLEDLVPLGIGAKVRAAWLKSVPTLRYSAQEARWRSSGADPRAAILFTSGSSGLPKAVVLSHANLLANVAQLRARIDFAHSDCVFNALPLFHAFGLTGGMLAPLLSGVRTVLYPTPLHYALIPEFVYSANATIFFATNSFLGGYARKAHAFDFVSLRYVFAGAEKLQSATQKLWSDRFGIRIFEGYGTTEASPALTMNTLQCCKPGTVGQFLPGIEYRLESVPGIEGGRLFFKGPNRMMGYYLPEVPGQLVEKGDWYDTGDIVAVDPQGFVSILGRAKRFAKIAGEMVSLSAVEEAVSSVCTGNVAVVSRPHPQKGEELVLFAAEPVPTAEVIREAVRNKGLSDLSVPKHIRGCSPFPLLGSGKPDLVALQKQALEDKA